MNDKVLSQITALPDKSAAELKTLWKELYQQEPPAFNKPYYLKRLAYRLQELAHGVDTRPLERKLEIHARQHLDAKGHFIYTAVLPNHANQQGPASCPQQQKYKFWPAFGTSVADRGWKLSWPLGSSSIIQCH